MLSTCRVRVPAGCPLHAPEAPEAQGSRPRGRARVDTCAARVPAPSLPTPRVAQPDPWFLPPRLLGRGPSVSRAIRSRRGASRSRQGAGGSSPRISRVARQPEAPRSARCARPHPHGTRSSAQVRRTGVRARPTSPCCSRGRTGGRTTCPRLCSRAARPEALGPTSPRSPATPRQRRSERRAAPSLGQPRRWPAHDGALPRPIGRSAPWLA